MPNSKPYLLDVQLLRENVESFDEYPFSIPAVRHLEQIEFHPRVTFLVGENGSGKSTLLEAIAVVLGLNPEGGSKNFNFGTRDSHSVLNKYLRLGRTPRRPRDMFFLRAESLFNVATEIEKLDDDPLAGPPIVDSFGGVSLHDQSHGESFLAVLSQRFYGKGLYLLDEPEAALSPARQLSALKLVYDLVQDDSQFIICTHSPILMGYPDCWIYSLNDDGIRRTEYKDTEHYAITSEFLARPERMLRILFDDES